MKIYLAGRWRKKLEFHPIRARIQMLGHTITSGWLDEPLAGDAAIIAAQRDFDDIDRADMLILWHEIKAPVETLYGGMFVEVGYALAKGKQVWAVLETKPTCIFLALPTVKRFTDWKAAFEELAVLAKPLSTVSAAHSEY